MSPAFAGFQEPHAWLIRGLVEYGWPDVTRVNGRVPPGVFGGFDLTRFSGSQGREGFSLCVPALADGDWLQEDGVYDFTVKMAHASSGQTVFTVRCPEANFLEEFPFDPANPQHVAGYIHQSLTTYVPDFVRWRQGGGEVTWAQRAGMHASLRPEWSAQSCLRRPKAYCGGWFCALPKKEKSTGRRRCTPVRKGDESTNWRDLKMGSSTSLPGW